MGVRIKILILAFGVFLTPEPGFAQSLFRGGAFTQVVPTGPIEMMNVVIPGQTTRNYDRYFILNIRHSCFGAAARDIITNALVPNADLSLEFSLIRPSGSTGIRVQYPSSIATVRAGTVGVAVAEVISSANKVPTSLRAAAYGNVLRLEIPISVVPTIDADGFVIAGATPRVEGYRFTQLVDPLSRTYFYPCVGPTAFCSVVGRTGPLISKVNIMQPKGSYSAEMQVSLPGQSEYCSGHF